MRRSDKLEGHTYYKGRFLFRSKNIKRAIDMTEHTAETSKTASLGALIHNQQVVERLAEQGIKVVNSV